MNGFFIFILNKIYELFNTLLLILNFSFLNGYFLAFYLTLLHN